MEAKNDATVEVDGITYKVFAGQPVPVHLQDAYNEAVKEDEPQKAKAEKAPEVNKMEKGPEVSKGRKQK